jgi:hypothetical protein
MLEDVMRASLLAIAVAFAFLVAIPQRSGGICFSPTPTPSSRPEARFCAAVKRSLHWLLHLPLPLLLLLLLLF